MSDNKILGPANFKKLVKRVDALENITITKLFKSLQPSPESFKIQCGGVLVSFNPKKLEEVQIVKQFLEHILSTNEEKDETRFSKEEMMVKL